jgi:protein-glutamine gamma-glutamyltransferase
MRFSQYFIIISYLIAGAGLIAVSLTNTINPVFLVGISLIVLLSLFLSIRGRHLALSRFVWNCLAVIILAAGLADYLFVSRSLIDVSVRFLTILMAAKLFDLKTNRDYAVLYILTFFQLLSASASTVNISFLFVLALYILTGIWALTIFNLKKDWEEKGTPHKEMAKNILGPYFFIATAGLAGLSLIITVSLFFIIPRMEIGFFSRQTADVLRVSGFSEKVDLGELGPIKLDPAIVMRVKLQPPLPPLLNGGLGGLYFRGISFDTYNNGQWQQTIKQLIPLKKDSSGIWNLNPRANPSSRASAILTQTILLEPIETNVLFAASNGLSVSGSLRNVMADGTGSLYLPAPSYSRIEYTAYSLLPPPSKPILPEHDYPEGVSSLYLHIPPGLERVSNLARDITMRKTTPFEKAKAIEEYLVRNFRYTLHPSKGRGKNPVEDFLFYTKEGYCEQYATSMAMMLRGAGIPSRLVTGFLPGEWNKFGNYLIIRQRDAHSWVEAYMPPTESTGGWTKFDPTPPAEAVGAMPPKTSVITLYIDSLKWKWNRYIINYSFRDQISLAKAVEGKGRSLMSKLKWNVLSNQLSISVARNNKLFIVITVFIISALIFIAILWRLGRLKAETRQSKAPLFYKNMLNILAKKGMIKKGGVTAMEFAKDVNIGEVKFITDMYYTVRFGGHTLTEKEQNTIVYSLKSLKLDDIITPS